MTKPSILVFAYHNVGYECLDALIQNDEYIMAVITHKDDPDEEIWFRSVAALARKYDIPVHTPESVNTPDWTERIRSWNPDLIFSFYYRDIINEDILKVPRLGAFNMHGSLLPKYRGRVPVNWAVLNGEKETGATLHHMVKRADAGDIVDQEAVPIAYDDSAEDVFHKVTRAARTIVERQIDALTAGAAPRKPQDESQATKFGGRKPTDGRIDWTKSAESIYNLVRAVTHPYPGAFTELDGSKLMVWWAKPITGVSGKAGEILSADPLRVAAGTGAIEIVNSEWDDGEDETDVHRLEVGKVFGG